MTETPTKLLALVLVVTVAGASAGPVDVTTGYFADREAGNAAVDMPERPHPSADDSNPVDEGDPVSLTGINSTDDAGIASYEWDFDDDGTFEGTGVNKTHTFEDSGTYTVTLKTTDVSGLTDTATTDVTVRNVPPTADAGPDQTVGVDETVALDAAGSSDPGADELRYEWDVDGDDDWELSGVGPEHEFSAEGEYNVTVRVTDGDGGSDTDSVNVTVTNVPPTANAGEDRTVVVGEQLTLDGTASSAGDSTDSLSYHWDLDGNGTFDAMTARPVVTYDSTGTRNVTLRLEDGDGGVDTDALVVTVVEDEEPPSADAGDDLETTVNETVGFDGTGSTDNAGIETYEWDFGDGATATGPKPEHTYTEAGSYTVELTVTDESGNTASDTVTVTVESKGPPSHAGPPGKSG